MSRSFVAVWYRFACRLLAWHSNRNRTIAFVVRSLVNQILCFMVFFNWDFLHFCSTEQSYSTAVCFHFAGQETLYSVSPLFCKKMTTHEISVLQERQEGGCVSHMTDDFRGRISATDPGYS
jgi:hypothetical protein